MLSRRFPWILLSFAFSVQAGVRFTVGSAATMLDRLRTENTRFSKTYTLPTSSAGQIQTLVTDFYHEKGQLSMVGRAMDSENSDFILKGDSRGIYGWVAYRDRNIAYEYTTDIYGEVVAEVVPVNKVIPVCDLHSPEGPESSPVPLQAPASMQIVADSLTPHIGPFPGNQIDVLKLQSLPGATKVYFIDYKLLLTAGGDTPKGQTKQDVWQTWQSVSAMLSAFKVNVTTDPAVYAAAGPANSGISSMKDVSGGSSSCGLNIFGTTRSCTVNRYNNGYATGRILSHEIGHGLGLSHDGGTPGGEYFNGLPTFQWTPLMGNVWPGDRWPNALYQFSIGEYNTATRQQDDWALMGRFLEFRDDDVTAVKPLRMQGPSVLAAMNRGQIGRNTDTDTYSFRIAGGGGRANLKIDRIEYMGGAMLDVDASILDASGRVVAQHNAPAARHALLNVALNDGEYTLVIKGGAEGSPAAGFSRYSSVGFYGIEGTLTSGVVGMTENSRFERSIRVNPLLDEGVLKFELPGNARVEEIKLVRTDGTAMFESRKRAESIDMSRFPAGVYVLKISVAGSTVVRTIIKK